MKDKVEDFINENKREFDLHEPPADLWSRIEKQLDENHKNEPKRERVVRLNGLLKLAAAVTIILCAGLWLWQYQYKQATDLANIDPALAKQQMHYASVIENQRTELKRIEKENPQLYQEFSSEIRKMDENYQKLKNDLPNSPNQEETVKAMIRNLQIQTQVLNQQLNIIQEINKSKKQSSNETQSI
jgi:flagellar biosynthesis GTPase FlhF